MTGLALLIVAGRPAVIRRKSRRGGVIAAEKKGPPAVRDRCGRTHERGAALPAFVALASRREASPFAWEIIFVIGPE
jgi:hypothetical protein